MHLRSITVMLSGAGLSCEECYGGPRLKSTLGRRDHPEAERTGLALVLSISSDLLTRRFRRRPSRRFDPT
jgi:hypothetical protein